MYTNGTHENNANSSTASGSNSAASTALQGATRAFGNPQIRPKPEVKPKPLAVKVANKEHGQDGALIAATSSWRSQSPSPTLKPNVQSRINPSPPRSALLPPPVLSPRPFKRLIVEPRSQSLPPSSPDDNVRGDTRIASQAPTDRKPLLPPPRRGGPGPGSVGSMGAATAAASLASSRRPSMSDLSSRGRAESVSGSVSVGRRAEKYQDQSLRMLEPHVTGDTLSNAIVGANLAVTHNPSRKATPQPSKARQLSPPKPMRESMRKYTSESSSDSDGRRFKIPGRRHPHKHHEGDRKRWRERISDEEYKRYASLWASNRGLWLTYPTPPIPPNVSKALDEEVCSLVVRDLWQRSKLPDSILSIIWDLVDSRKIGRLTKNEFIVGMYLIDQKLRGNKLPHRVADSTWESVTRWSATGAKIRIT